MNLGRMLAIRSSKTVFRDGERAVKVFDEDFSAGDVLHEALNQARAAQAGLPVPQVLEVTQLEGRWSIVSEYIPGVTLWQAMERNPEKKDEYLERFVRLQYAIHSTRAPLLGRLRDRLDRRIDYTDLQATTRYALHSRLAELAHDNALCHGDYQPSNLILRDDGKLFVIDWPHAAQGNPAADAAGTYLQLCLTDGEEMAKRYLARFCAVSAIEPLAVRLWIPVVAASQSVGSIAETRELLLYRARSVGQEVQQEEAI